MKFKLPAALADFDAPTPRKPLPSLPESVSYPQLDLFQKLTASEEDCAAEWPKSLRPLTSVELDVLQERDPFVRDVLPSGFGTLYYADVTARRVQVQRLTANRWRYAAYRFFDSDGRFCGSNRHLLMTSVRTNKRRLLMGVTQLKEELISKFGMAFQ